MKKEAPAKNKVIAKISSIIETSLRTGYAAVNTEIIFMYWKQFIEQRNANA